MGRYNDTEQCSGYIHACKNETRTITPMNVQLRAIHDRDNNSSIRIVTCRQEEQWQAYCVFPIHIYNVHYQDALQIRDTYLATQSL